MQRNGYTGYDYTWYFYGSFFVDIDECTSGTWSKWTVAVVGTNTAGSFSCTYNSPYLGNGRSCYIPSGDNSSNITGRCPFTRPLFTLVWGGGGGEGG